MAQTLSKTVIELRGRFRRAIDARVRADPRPRCFRSYGSRLDSEHLAASLMISVVRAEQSQGTHSRKLNRVRMSLRDGIAVARLKQTIEAWSLPNHREGTPKMRLELESEYIDDSSRPKGALCPEKMRNLRRGEAFMWSSQATDDVSTKMAVKTRRRPRVTYHGGAKKTAVGR